MAIQRGGLLLCARRYVQADAGYPPARSLTPGLLATQ